MEKGGAITARIDEFGSVDYDKILANDIYSYVKKPEGTIDLTMQTGALGDRGRLRSGKVLYCSKTNKSGFALSDLLFENKSGIDTDIFDRVGFSPKWEFLTSQFNEMVTPFTMKVSSEELICTVAPYISLLSLPYLGMNPSMRFCDQVELNCEAAAGDLGSLSIQRSLVRHTEHPLKQGSLAASLLAFLREKRKELSEGMIPSIEANYKVAHRERVMAFPDRGEVKDVQTRTVCAPEGGVKI